MNGKGFVFCRVEGGKKSVAEQDSLGAVLKHVKSPGADYNRRGANYAERMISFRSRALAPRVIVVPTSCNTSVCQTTVFESGSISLADP